MKNTPSLLFSLLLLGGTYSTSAGELIYTPTNPSFGGNSLNGNYLLGKAQAQNDKKDPNARISTQRSSLDRFVDSLSSRLLSELLFGIQDGNTGSLVTDDFSVDIVDDGLGGLTVFVTDLESGETTEVSVSGLGSQE